MKNSNIKTSLGLIIIIPCFFLTVAAVNKAQPDLLDILVLKLNFAHTILFP